MKTADRHYWKWFSLSSLCKPTLWSGSVTGRRATDSICMCVGQERRLVLCSERMIWAPATIQSHLKWRKIVEAEQKRRINKTRKKEQPSTTIYNLNIIVGLCFVCNLVISAFLFDITSMYNTKLNYFLNCWISSAFFLTKRRKMEQSKCETDKWKRKAVRKWRWAV